MKLPKTVQKMNPKKSKLVKHCRRATEPLKSEKKIRKRWCFKKADMSLILQILMYHHGFLCVLLYTDL